MTSEWRSVVVERKEPDLWSCGDIGDKSRKELQALAVETLLKSPCVTALVGEGLEWEELERKVNAMVRRVSESYRPNSYHNFAHGVDVMVRADSLARRVQGLPKLIHACLLCSALWHDADHRGVSNAELVAEGHPLAIRYNDQSVAEHNSLSLMFECLAAPDMDITAGLKPDHKRHFRDIAIDCVLATDVGASWVSARAFQEFGVCNSRESGWDMESKFDRLALTRMLLKVADIGSIGAKFHIHIRWGIRLFKEICAKKDEFTYDEFYDQQKGFFKTYVAKLFTAISGHQDFKDSGIIENYTNNVATWKALDRAGLLTAPLEEFNKDHTAVVLATADSGGGGHGGSSGGGGGGDGGGRITPASDAVRAVTSEDACGRGSIVVAAVDDEGRSPTGK